MDLRSGFACWLILAVLIWLGWWVLFVLVEVLDLRMVFDFGCLIRLFGLVSCAVCLVDCDFACVCLVFDFVTICEFGLGLFI